MIAVAVALAAIPPPEGPPPAPSATESAYTAWTHCLSAQERLADPQTPARRVAEAAVRACEPLQRELVAAHETWMAEVNFVEPDRARERRGLARHIRKVRANVLRVVRDMRRD